MLDLMWLLFCSIWSLGVMVQGSGQMGELLGRRRHRRHRRRRQYPNDPKMTAKLRKVLFPEIGHVTKFQEQVPPKKQGSTTQPLGPPARRPHFQDPGNDGDFNFQYFQHDRKYEKSIFQGCWKYGRRAGGFSGQVLPIWIIF